MLQAFTKRFCLLTVVMLLSVVNALAQVAKIGDTEYATLKAAFEAVPTDGTETTITLLADLPDAPIDVNANKNVTLDFNGHSLGTTAEYGVKYQVGSLNLVGEGTLTTNVGIKNASLTVGENITINGLVFMSSGVLNMAGTVNSNTFAIATNGASSKNVTINILPGANIVSSNTTAVYLPGNTGLVCNVSGGEISGISGIEIRAGELNVTGGKITATGSQYSYTPNNNGPTTMGAGIAVAQHTTLLPMDVVVSGASFKGPRNISVVDAQNNGLSGITVKANVYDLIIPEVPAGYNWIADENGLSVLAQDVYEIGTVEQLKAFCEKVNKGEKHQIGGGQYLNGDLVGKTIKLTADLDLQGEEWTPILLDVKEPYGRIRTVFDGNNHTISNLTISSQPDLNAGVGLFSYLGGVTLKNLTLKNVNIKGNYKVGAFVGGEEGIAHIDKCHLDGATIITSVVDNDNAQHVGGIVGYLASSKISSVTNCSVKNVTIQGYRDMGSIVGTLNSVNYVSEISGCSAENVTLIHDNTTNYKNYAEPSQTACNIHEIVGRVLGTSNTIENNTYKNVNFVWGKIANDKATITKVEIAQEGVKNVTVSAAIGSADVTEIAEGAFASLPNTVQTIDLSSTKVALEGKRSEIEVLSVIPENVLVYLPSTSSVSGTNVVIKDADQEYTCESLFMEDQNDYSIPTAFTAETATLKRSFTANVASTLCLPYDVPATSISGKIYRFKSIDLTACTITMTEDADGLDANVPYIFMPNADTDKISASSSASDIEVKMETPQTTQGNFTFVGVFEKKEFTETECQNGIYGYAGQNVDQFTVGQFVKVGYGSKVAGMRAYLVNNGVAGAPAAPGLNGAAAATSLPSRFNVQLQNANGETTEILSLDMETAEDGSPVYNLSGQRVNNAQKGIYIKNGKKVIIK